MGKTAHNFEVCQHEKEIKGLMKMLSFSTVNTAASQVCAECLSSDLRVNEGREDQ